MMDYNSERESDLLVSWNVTFVNSTNIDLQLGFSSPFKVSQGDKEDKLLLFFDLSRYKSEEGEQQPAEFIFIVADVPD